MLSADIEAHGHTGGCPGRAERCYRMEERSNHTTTNVERESERSLRELLRDKQGRMRPETESLRQSESRKRARVERGAGDVPVEPGNR